MSILTLLIFFSGVIYCCPSYHTRSALGIKNGGQCFAVVFLLPQWLVLISLSRGADMQPQVLVMWGASGFGSLFFRCNAYMKLQGEVIASMGFSIIS